MKYCFNWQCLLYQMHQRGRTHDKETHSLQKRKLTQYVLYKFIIIIIPMFNYLFYPNCIPCISLTCSLYISNIKCRLDTLSPAMHMERRQVFFWEFGWRVLQSCMLSLKLPWPLSPPSLNHSSFSGILLWWVSPSGVLNNVVLILCVACTGHYLEWLTFHVVWPCLLPYV